MYPEAAVVSAEAVIRWWVQLADVEGPWRRVDGFSFEQFRRVVAEADAVYEFPWGLAWIENHPKGITLHPVFWGRPRRQDEEALKAIAGHFGKRRIFIAVPLFVRSLRVLAERFGFHVTGRFREIGFPGGELSCMIWEREV